MSERNDHWISDASAPTAKQRHGQTGPEKQTIKARMNFGRRLSDQIARGESRNVRTLREIVHRTCQRTRSREVERHRSRAITAGLDVDGQYKFQRPTSPTLREFYDGILRVESRFFRCRADSGRFSQAQMEAHRRPHWITCSSARVLAADARAIQEPKQTGIKSARQNWRFRRYKFVKSIHCRFGVAGSARSLDRSEPADFR